MSKFKAGDRVMASGYYSWAPAEAVVLEVVSMPPPELWAYRVEVPTANPPRSWHGTGWVQWEHELTHIPSQSGLLQPNPAGGFLQAIVPRGLAEWLPSEPLVMGVDRTSRGTPKPEPNCPQCGKKAAPEHVEVASSKMSAKCKCWWCGGTWEEMLHG